MNGTLWKSCLMQVRRERGRREKKKKGEIPVRAFGEGTAGAVGEREDGEPGFNKQLVSSLLRI
jgi:hypothetical protein